MDTIDKLKAYMADKKLNQRTMAIELGVNESVLNRWLNKRVKPSVVWQRVISTVIGG
jgi:transcriptional regulator with XRE-family HTH domain